MKKWRMITLVSLASQ